MFIILKFKFYFYDTLFRGFCFSVFFHCHLLNNCILLVLIQQTLYFFSHLMHLALTQLLFYSFLKVMVCLIYNLKYQILFQYLLKYLCKCAFFLFRPKSSLYPCNVTLLFLQMLVSRNRT